LNNKQKIQVAIDTTYLIGPGSDRGLGRYTRAVMEGSTVLGAPFSVRPVSVRPWQGAAELLEMPVRELKLMRRHSDLYHAMSPSHASWLQRRRSLVSILDCISLDVPAYTRTGAKSKIQFGIAGKSAVILTLTEFTRQRLSERLQLPPEGILLAPLPSVLQPASQAQVESVRQKYALHAPFVLSLADYRTFDPRKRYEYLKVLTSTVKDLGYDQVVVGPGSSEYHAGSSIRGLGRVDDHDLASLLTGASLFVFPSAYEGQGMPPQEAISCGTPAVAFNNSSMPEVIGRAGLLVEDSGLPWEAAMPPHAVTDDAAKRLADAVARALTEPSLLASLERECAAQTRTFSQARFNTALRHSYERVLQ
jgi:glycosyltransferase involved in cell wall biosynthesis